MYPFAHLQFGGYQMNDTKQNPTKGARKQSYSARINLVDFASGKEPPGMAVYALDRARQPIFQAGVSKDGQFEFPDEVFDKAAYLVIGPAAEKFSDIDISSLLSFRTRRWRSAYPAGSIIDLPERDWSRFFTITLCVSGTVKHCYPWHWWVNDLAASVVFARASQANFLNASITQRAALNNLAIGRSAALRPFWQHCEPVCDGLVEVYRRTCCCHFVGGWEPRIPDLLDILEKFLERVPVRWPPIPEPDPEPWFQRLAFSDGVLNDMALNAGQDLAALRSLPLSGQVEYIRSRPYLFHYVCTCGSWQQVASGMLRSDGGFSICWSEPLRLMLLNCEDQYTYVVKQNIGGSTVTIYDGRAANKVFDYDDEAELVSYHPQAQGCRHNDFPDTEGAFVLLQDIGLTESHRLKTPNATGWDRVAAPGYNDGLVDPVLLPADALGLYRNRNWGGSLYLRYHFSEPMKAVGARYYRISVSAADGSGNPTGPRTYFQDGLTWKKYVPVGTDIEVQTDVMGPFSQGGEDYLYKIAYDVDADWQSGQYHGWVNTTNYTNSRHLITIEVFNAAGQRLRPNGTPGAGLDAAFTFRRWYQPTGPTANVPFAALTHMFWWDNRRAEADIIDLRHNGAPSMLQCQFLEGPGTDTFSVGYVAYHPEPMFLLNHSLWWQRGLGGPTGYLVNHSPNNVGPGLGVSPTATFAAMLGPEQKCSFSLHLYANVKTTNGFGTLDALDDWETAAFALLKT
jgi:hypothetical protein